MQNVDVKVKDGKAVITIDLNKEFGPSRTGKTIIVASTHGNQPIGDNGVRLGLNAYKFPTTEPTA